MDYLTRFPKKTSLLIYRDIIQECVRLSKDGLHCKALQALFEKGLIREICEYSFNYNDCESSDDEHVNDFLYGRQIQALFTKDENLKIPGVNPKQNCLDAFIKTERHCMVMNYHFFHQSPHLKRFEPILYRAQRIISTVLGKAPSFSDLNYSFGPGVNTSTKVDDANARIKLSSSLECSANLFERVWEFLNEFPHWGDAHLYGVAIALARFGTVAKNWKTLRTIIIETILNGFGQKAIGSEIRSKLKAFGINLRDQTRNQKLAYIGSVTGKFATIDLSNASNTICYGLVLSLLPPEWFSLLELFRADEVTMEDGTSHKLQLFSSMGNGYTFELESLIFYAIAVAVQKHHGVKGEISVYGDDIIVPSELYEPLSEVLSAVGFTINSDKSFASGPFRESCGADYLFGIDIRPFYVKEALTVRNLFTMHNWFMRRFEFSLASIVMRHIPEHVKLFGPDGYGDGHLIGNYQIRQGRRLKRDGCEGGFFDTYTLIGRKNRKAYPNDWVYPVYSVYVRSGRDSPTEPDIIRGTRGFEKVSIYTLADTIFGIRPDIDVGTLLGQRVL